MTGTDLNTTILNIINILHGPWVVGLIAVVLFFAIIGALLEWHHMSFNIVGKVLFLGALLVSSSWLITQAFGSGA